VVTPFSGQQRFLRDATKTIRRVGVRPNNLTSVETLSRTKQEPWYRSKEAGRQKLQERTTLRRQPASNDETSREAEGTSMWLGKRDPRVDEKDWNARRRELQWLKDPLEVANFVKKELGKDKGREMLQLVRMASHSMQCVVSWNHLIDYYCAKERVSEALKVYNEAGLSDAS
jgi:pentatricopeptide repeat protein